MRLTQHRYLPIGSEGNYHQQWKIPACIAYGQGDERQEACRLLEKPLTTWLLQGECPDWLLANAQGAGYYRWNYPGTEWLKILAVANELSPEEQIKLADSFVAAFIAGGIGLTDFLDGTYRLAQLPTRQAVIAAMPVLTNIVEVWSTDLKQREQAQSVLQNIYAQALAKVGLGQLDDYEQAEYQHSLVDFQALTVEDASLREHLLAQAAAYVEYAKAEVLDRDTVNLSLVDIALEVAVQEWGLDFVEHLYARLKESQDPVLRRRITRAFSVARNAAAAERVRGMVLDPNLRNNEVFGIIFNQINEPQTRNAAWQWLQQDFDAVLKRIPEWAQGRLAGVGRNFCSAQERQQLDNFFSPRVNDLGGGPLTLTNTLESIDLCLAQRAHYQEDFDRLLKQSQTMSIRQ